MFLTNRSGTQPAINITTMKTGDSLRTTMPIRSRNTGVVLPRHGTFIRDVENLGRKLILVDFGSAGEEYLFPHEVLVLDEPRNVQSIEGLRLGIRRSLNLYG